MTQPRLTPRTLYKKIFFLAAEADNILAAFPAFLLEALLQTARPAENTAERLRRRYSFEAVIASQTAMLALYLLFDGRGWDTRLLPYGLAAYFIGVQFFQYRPGDPRLVSAAGSEIRGQRRFAADLKITKLMLATWAMFFLSIQFLLPH